MNEQMFAVVPLNDCPHLCLVQKVPACGIKTSAPCILCQSISENWTCLICYIVCCGRYINEHMALHSNKENHPLVLSFSDLSVWCYKCEAYIDNKILYEAKNVAHKDKFGTELPWSYGPKPSSS